MPDDSSGDLPDDVVAVLTALLSSDRPGFAELRGQIPYARTTEPCGCGCATVSLEVARDGVEPAAAAANPVAEADVSTTDGRLGGVLLFVTDGYLSLLEIYSLEEEPFATWPRADQLTVRL
ncbi:hypothetical protein AB0D12_27565 [Streptomyces sp. NPDC048479]|uniref:hypothetical protein n=1 Tax=Streptomyces sp. NPDC048479 TaxID=3154725 RepID=UPI0034231063